MCSVGAGGAGGGCGDAKWGRQQRRREVFLGMGWRRPGGLCYHLAFLFSFHHFGWFLACEWGRRKQRDCGLVPVASFSMLLLEICQGFESKYSSEHLTSPSLFRLFWLHHGRFVRGCLTLTLCLCVKAVNVDLVHDAFEI